ncbi:MAG: hypothetical protein ACN4E6_01675 [Qipengyuania pacifica]
MAYQKTAKEIRSAFDGQISALRSSCAAFDNGEQWEAPRIASAISILCHDAGKTVSLLTQLGIRNEMQFVSSVGSPITDTNLVVSHPLVAFQFTPDGVKASALLEGPFTREWNFNKWWKQEVIAAGPLKAWSLTRNDLIRSVRNQDGGGHVDAQLSDEAYIQLSRTVHWSTFREGQLPASVMGLEQASVRQIGWELLQSLERAGDI